MASAMKRCLVIGGGTGLLVAAELASRGLAVDLVEKQPRLMFGATGNTGRRLHLGEHYSADPVALQSPEINTGRLCFVSAAMMALTYPDVYPKSSRWWQFITRDSMTSVEGYEQHLASLRAFHKVLAQRDPRIDVLFGRASQRHRRLDQREYSNVVATERVSAGFESVEGVLNIHALRRTARRRFIECRTGRILLNTAIEQVEPRGNDGFRAHLVDQSDRTRQARSYQLIINAAWTDAHSLLPPMVNSVVRGTARLKCMAIVTMPPLLGRLPSMYFHRGVYGSHTNIDGRQGIVTSEPVSNLAFAPISDIPKSWSALLHQPPNDPIRYARSLRDVALQHSNAYGSTGSSSTGRMLAGLADKIEQVSDIRSAQTIVCDRLLNEVMNFYSSFVPESRRCVARRLVVSTVMNLATAHLNDPESAVHQRGYYIPELLPGYFWFYPGKLTFAQMAAVRLANKVSTGDSARSDLLNELDEVLGDGSQYEMR